MDSEYTSVIASKLMTLVSECVAVDVKLKKKVSSSQSNKISQQNSSLTM